ncbi:MAG: hypothetical protein PHS79_02695 [Patescibacteria group bacterium]|nr:hypothetical protein [Patescibacteria group bacterium]
MAVAKRIERWMASTFSGEDSMRKPTALISVFDKTGIVEFARDLVDLGWDIISSGGTAKALRAAGLEVRDVAELSGLAAILDHRVVTLVPQVHAGLLALDKPEHDADRAKINAPWIDMVCVNLYPLEAAIAKPDATTASVIESTDIGGPTMLSSAAKGRRVVICDPADYGRVLAWLKEDRPNTEAFVTELCAKADGMVAGYRLASARFHSDGAIEGMIGTKAMDCKYGEAPYMTAALFRTNDNPLAVHSMTSITGTAPSYINLTDLDRLRVTVNKIAATLAINGFPERFIASVVKHGNVCGVGIATTPGEAITKMIDSDIQSVHGGVAMCNFLVGESEAEFIRNYKTSSDNKRMLDGLAAPGVTEAAGQVMERKRGKCRVFENPALARMGFESLDRVSYRALSKGNFLRQEGEPFVLEVNDPRINRLLGDLDLQQKVDIALAFAIGSTADSNTITLVRDGMLLGQGVRQTSRVRAAMVAVMNAQLSGHNTHGALAYSDSFFPFQDGPEVLARAGVKVIFASSGSINDESVRDFCRSNGVNLWTLPDKVCRGFFGH